MLWIGFSQISLLISNFILLKLLSSELSVHEYGQYALIMSIALFVRQIFYDPFSIVVAKKTGAEPGILCQSLCVAKKITDRIAAGLLLGSFLFAFFIYIATGSHFVSVLLVCGVIYVCANGMQGFYINIFNSIGDRMPPSIISVIDSFGRIFVVFLTFGLIGGNLVYAIFSISFGAVISIAIFKFYINFRVASSEEFLEKNNILIKQTFLMSLPFVLPTLLLGLKSIGDRWILASYLGVSDLAGYSVLLQIGYSPMILFFGMLQTYIAPKIYIYGSMSNHDSVKDFKYLINKILSLILFVAFLACVVLMVVGDWMFNFLVGENYKDLAFHLPSFVMAGAFSAAAGILQLAVIGVLKSKDASYLLALTLLVGMACTTLFIFEFGFNGAVAGLIGSAFITLVIYWRKLNRVLNLKIQNATR